MTASRSAMTELSTSWIGLFVSRHAASAAWTGSSMTSIMDPLSESNRNRTTTRRLEPRNPLLIRDLGWSRREAAEIRRRLLPFEDDWNAPGMDAYDAL
jgi:hypothetical protein